MKLALITGATKGIGRDTARAFASKGWDLILVARNKVLLESLRDELSVNASKINIYQCDLSDPQKIINIFPKILKECGCPSVLINNAGFAFNGDLIGMPLEQWERTMQINLTSVFQICSLIVPRMRREGGLIINVSSHAAYNSFPQWGSYCVSKAALMSFTKCLREEERLNGIRACTITLGSVNTSFWDSEFVKSDFNRDLMLSSKSVAETILNMANQPPSLLFEDITLMPASGAF